jgi:phage baseplate assembly protein W
MAARTPAPQPIGWPLLPLPDASGELRFPDIEQSVRESIRVILSTRPGEQLMRAGFGAGLDTLIHEPNTVATRRRMRDLITESLGAWERRIILDRVDVREAPEAPSHIRVEIAYRLARTGQPQQVGLTIQLEA